MGILRRLRIGVGLLSALALTLGFSVLVSAQDETLKQLPPDVRVIIDISGSMKQNDPNNLRQPALELLVQLLPEGSKAGVWTFGKNINMLVPHRPVTGSWREDATAKAAKINSVGLFTNIGEALEKAGYDVDRPSKNYRTSLILLTDGLVDISRDPAENQAEWRRIVDQVLPPFEQAGYTIHTIALSDNADAELMNKLALRTDGMAAVAKTADELMKIFLKAFDQAAPAEQVPLEENRFVIDSSVEEFTALIFRQPGSEPTQLIGPDRSRYSFDIEQQDVSWYRTDAYDLITMQRPLEGEWKVKADLDPDSRVTVVSNLNLLVKPLPTNIYAGETLDVSLLLQEDGKTINRAEFLRLLDINSQVDHADSDGHWQQSLSAGLPPGDGIYRTSYQVFDSEGDYALKVLVDGKTFKREFSHSLSVRQPFGVTLEKDASNGQTQYVVTVSSYSSDLDIQKTKVVARVKDPRGRGSIKPLALTEVDNWRLAITPEQEGAYLVNLRVNAVDKQGNSFEFTPEAVRFSYPDVADPFAALPAEPEPILAPAEALQPEPEKQPQPEAEKQPQPEPVAEPEPAPALPEEEAEAEEQSNWMLYAGLGVGNLLIIVLAFMAYRMIMGSKDGGDSLKEMEEAMEETAASVDEVPESPSVPDGASEQDAVAEPPTLEPEPPILEEEPALSDMGDLDEPPALDAEPAMDDFIADAELDSPEADEQLAESLMGAELDLSEDAPEEMAPGADESVSDDDLLGGEFSLDDFAPDEDEEKV